MSKEYMQALEDLFGLVAFQGSFEKAQKYFDIIEEALQRLESVDNANPSEALECLEALEQDIKDRVILAEDRQLKLCAVIKQVLLKQQEHNSVNLLMQELDCKDFADLRKYARCGYEKLNKNYLKWEDLEFKEEEQTMKVLLNGKEYMLSYFTDGIYNYIDLLTDNMRYPMGRYVDCYSYEKQFFNDLHLERVEE